MTAELTQSVCDDKLLSIIIPSFNMEKYLEKCLKSTVVTDDGLFRRLDILVVNDGSCDNTSAIAHSFGRKYKINQNDYNREYECSNGTIAKVTDYGIIQVIDKPNNHYGSCINAALVIAKGKYIKILDADDYLDTESFTKFVAKLANLSESPDVVFSDYDIVDEFGKRRTYFDFSNFYPHEKLFDFSAMSDIITPAKYHGGHCTTYRTQLLRDMHYTQTEKMPYTDTEWYILPFLYANQAYYIRGSLIHYLIGREGQTTDLKYMHSNFKKFESMMLNLLSTIEKLRPLKKCVNQNFVDVRTSMIFVTMYNMVIFDFPKAHLAPIDFEYTDRQLKQISPKYYEQLDNLSISRIKFHYVREWRKGYTRKTFKFMFFSFYQTITKYLGTILYKIRCHILTKKR